LKPGHEGEQNKSIEVNEIPSVLDEIKVID